MKVDELRKRILGDPIYASDGNHSARLWRVAENVQHHARLDGSDDRLHHLMLGSACFAEALQVTYAPEK